MTPDKPLSARLGEMVESGHDGLTVIPARWFTARAADARALEAERDRLRGALEEGLPALERLYDANKKNAGMRDLRVLNRMRAALAPRAEREEGT